MQYKNSRQDPTKARQSSSSFQQTSSSTNSPQTSIMKLLIVVALFAAASANVLQNPWPFTVVTRGTKTDAEVKPVAILRSTNDLKEDGSWKHSFASEDGIQVEASGFQKRLGPKPEDVGAVSRGSYSYVTPEGVVLTVNWTADENGFQAKGDHFPVAPPMPEHVVKMLADLRAAGRL
ncbi:putative Endocuticle structural glycoprotein SgAbd-1 [Daphnia magna]|uniref:Putative Endocuticle structural glycoprotein SgAbd-1 n=1 Tax=Daphnia magna TaxID=35525 RepID=A0A0P6A1T0_9CRUS|nr:putative Endocuticle structural glycoprotein SgAbd-1 [Daphnia magna]